MSSQHHPYQNISDYLQIDKNFLLDGNGISKDEREIGLVKKDRLGEIDLIDLDLVIRKIKDHSIDPVKDLSKV